MERGGGVAETCLNPPQGLSSIPTYVPYVGTIPTSDCLNPPQGLSSIPTPLKDLEMEEQIKRLSQSPAGSQLDSDSLGLKPFVSKA